MERISYQEVPNKLFEKLRAIEDYLAITIDKKLLELIYLRISQINECAYCVDMHYKELKHQNETELRLSSLCVWRETPYFTEKERAVLLFSETITKLYTDAFPDETYNNLEKYFSKSEICTLTLAITQINTWNRLMKVFQFTPGNYTVNQ